MYIYIYVISAYTIYVDMCIYKALLLFCVTMYFLPCSS